MGAAFDIILTNSSNVCLQHILYYNLVLIMKPRYNSAVFSALGTNQ